MLDRSLSPSPGLIEFRPFPQVEEATLNNGIRLYGVQFGDMPLAEVQLVFRAGNCYEPLPGQGSLAVKMLREGTRKRTAAQFAEALDGLGAFLGLETGYEIASVSISSLTEALPGALALLAEAVQEPAFPEQEFELLRSRTLQGLAVEAQRTAFHARNLFMEGLFGPQHPYGRIVDAEKVKALALEHIQDYHRTHLHPSNAFVLVAGQFRLETVLAELNQHFGHLPAAGQAPAPQLPATAHTAEQGQKWHRMEGKAQSTVRVGHLGLPRSHPQFHDVRFACMVLGGYFGSRLMQNIREKRGYTYGVYANWVALKHGGYFMMGADVSNAYVGDTLLQMRVELERLCTEPLPPDELMLVRNFLMGRMLSRLETPFEVAEVVKSLLANHVPISDEDAAFHHIKELSAETVLAAAQRHLHPQALLEVVCGG